MSPHEGHIGNLLAASEAFRKPHLYLFPNQAMSTKPVLYTCSATLLHRAFVHQKVVRGYRVAGMGSVGAVYQLAIVQGKDCFLGSFCVLESVD